MQRSITLASLLVVAVVHVQAADPRVCALRRKDLAGLKDICDKAQLACEPDADAETIRAMIYEKMQGEIPGKVGVDPWPGPGQPGECDEQGGAKAQGGGTTEDMGSMIFRKLDADHDGKLTKAEIQPMVDQVNQAAKAKGEAEYDLFASLDTNKDGIVEKDEASAVFERISKGQSPGGGQEKTGPALGSKEYVAAEGERIAKMLFDSLDKDKNGKLDKTEFQSIVEQMAAKAKAQGEKPEDFWASLDQNTDGFIDRDEASTFFTAMAATLASSGGGGGARPKDEV